MYDENEKNSLEKTEKQGRQQQSLCKKQMNMWNAFLFLVRAANLALEWSRQLSLNGTQNETISPLPCSSMATAYLKFAMWESIMLGKVFCPFQDVAD